MSYNFNLPFQGEATSLVDKAKAAILQAGGTMTGDNSEGVFFINSPVGKIEGKYLVEDQKLNIEITKKPFFVSNGMIEEKLGEYLKS